MPKVDIRSRRDQVRMRSRSTGLPKTYLVQDGAELPILEVEADKAVPDLKLVPAAETRRHRRRSSRPSGPRGGGLLPRCDRPGARLVPCEEPIRTGADGTFHLDQLDPDDKVGLWARAGDATTNGTIVARPEARARSRSRWTRSTPSGSAAW